MRTTTRLCLVASIVTAVGLSATVPAAGAAERPGSVNITGTAAHHKDKKQNKKIRKIGNKADNAHQRISRLKEWNFILQNWNSAQQKSIDTILAGVPSIIGGLEALEAGLLAVQAALEGPIAEGFEDIEDALNDSTTGLVGLNQARPLIGAVLSNAAAPGSQFTVVHPAAGTYVLRFERLGDPVNVTQRVIQLTSVLGSVRLLQSTPCAASPSATGACDAALGGAGTSTNADALVHVRIADSPFTLTDGDFQVAAITG